MHTHRDCKLHEIWDCTSPQTFFPTGLVHHSLVPQEVFNIYF